MKERNKQSTSMIKYASKDCHASVASFSTANIKAQHGKSFNEGDFLKEAWLACVPSKLMFFTDLCLHSMN